MQLQLQLFNCNSELKQLPQMTFREKKNKKKQHLMI